jgi:DNA helicase-2/ATP-dependent DNA helicase PcrA
MPDELLEALDPDQREVATTLTGPVCVLAGAGTGKTRAITHRIAYGVRTGVYVPTSVLAVTFTARAAGEMRTRLRTLGVEGVQARTFHAAALRQLAYFWPRVIGGAVPGILEHKAPVVVAAANQLDLPVDRVTVRDLAAEIEWAKVSLLTPEDYPVVAAAQNRPAPAGFDHHTVARLMIAYEDATRGRGVIDFEDVLLHLASFLADYPAIADEVRRQYRRFVVDEYQDVSPLQQFLLQQWLGDREELCVVGDPNQTIYSFAGATPNYLLNFRKTYPQATTIELVRDYRSTPQVVELANQIMVRRRSSRELIAQQPPGPPVTFTVHPDDQAEAHDIAARASRLIQSGVPASEIAVLYRTNGQSEAFEVAFADAGVGYQVRGGERFFVREEIRRLMVLLRGAARVVDPNLTMPEQVRDLASTVGWSSEAPSAGGAARDRWESLNAVILFAEDLHTERGATMADLVEELTERQAAQHAPAVDGVTLATLHAAKGLEWQAVFLAGLSDGLLPISLAETDDAIAEEKRLLYVGITRAKEHLHLSYALARNVGGRSGRKVCRFLTRVWPGSTTRQAKGRGKPARILTGDVDPDLFEALRAWRLEVAKTIDKPAYTVLIDATLAEIAEVKPADLAELATIKGIGPTKLTTYGEQVLRIVAAHRR